MTGTSSAIPEHLWMYARQVAQPQTTVARCSRVLAEAVSTYSSTCSYGAALVPMIEGLCVGADNYLTSTGETDSWVRAVGDGFAQTDSGQLTDAQIQAGPYEQLTTLADATLITRIEALAAVQAASVQAAQDSAAEQLALEANHNPESAPGLIIQNTFADGVLANPRAMAAFLNSLNSSATGQIATYLANMGDSASAMDVMWPIVAAYDSGAVSSKFTHALYAALQSQSSPYHISGSWRRYDRAFSGFDAGLGANPVAATIVLGQLGISTTRNWVQDDWGAAAIVVAANLDVLADPQHARSEWSASEIQGYMNGLVSDGVDLSQAVQDWITRHLQAMPPPGDAKSSDWTTFDDRTARLVRAYSDAQGSAASDQTQRQAQLISITSSAFFTALGIPLDPVAAAALGLGGPALIRTPDPAAAEQQAKAQVIAAAQVCVVAAMLSRHDIYHWYPDQAQHLGPEATGDPNRLVADIIDHPGQYVIRTTDLGYTTMDMVTDHIAQVVVHPAET